MEKAGSFPCLAFSRRGQAPQAHPAFSVCSVNTKEIGLSAHCQKGFSQFRMGFVGGPRDPGIKPLSFDINLLSICHRLPFSIEWVFMRREVEFRNNKAAHSHACDWILDCLWRKTDSLWIWQWMACPCASIDSCLCVNYLDRRKSFQGWIGCRSCC